MYIDYDEDIGIVEDYEQIPVYKDYDGQFYQDFEGLDDEEEPIEIINKEEKAVPQRNKNFADKVRKESKVFNTALGAVFFMLELGNIDIISRGQICLFGLLYY